MVVVDRLWRNSRHDKQFRLFFVSNIVNRKKVSQQGRGKAQGGRGEERVSWDRAVCR